MRFGSLIKYKNLFVKTNVNSDTLSSWSKLSTVASQVNKTCSVVVKYLFNINQEYLSSDAPNPISLLLRLERN